MNYFTQLNYAKSSLNEKTPVPFEGYRGFWKTFCTQDYMRSPRTAHSRPIPAVAAMVPTPVIRVSVEKAMLVLLSMVDI